MIVCSGLYYVFLVFLTFELLAPGQKKDPGAKGRGDSKRQRKGSLKLPTLVSPSCAMPKDGMRRGLELA